MINLYYVIAISECANIAQPYTAMGQFSIGVIAVIYHPLYESYICSDGGHPFMIYQIAKLTRGRQQFLSRCIISSRETIRAKSIFLWKRFKKSRGVNIIELVLLRIDIGRSDIRLCCLLTSDHKSSMSNMAITKTKDDL